MCLFLLLLLIMSNVKKASTSIENVQISRGALVLKRVGIAVQYICSL